MSKVHIDYYTDPLCCWSWAMERHWKKLQAAYEGLLTWRYCMGGLLPDWSLFHDSVHQVSRPIQMGPVWMEAAHLTNTEIDSGVWFKNPPSSSYLACIAVKCAGLQSPGAEDEYLHMVRKAIMKEGRDISHANQLITIADRLESSKKGLDLARFINDLYDGSGMRAFSNDLDEVKRFTIQRFPTLVMKSALHTPVMLTGYREYESLAQTVEMMMGNTSSQATHASNLSS